MSGDGDISPTVSVDPLTCTLNSSSSSSSKATFTRKQFATKEEFYETRRTYNNQNRKQRNKAKRKRTLEGCDDEIGSNEESEHSYSDKGDDIVGEDERNGLKDEDENTACHKNAESESSENNNDDGENGTFSTCSTELPTSIVESLSTKPSPEVERILSVAAHLERQEAVRAALDGSGIRIVVDCSFGYVMNTKEIRSLAKQLELCISHNWHAICPAALTFVSYSGAVSEILKVGRLGPPLDDQAKRTVEMARQIQREMSNGSSHSLVNDAAAFLNAANIDGAGPSISSPSKPSPLVESMSERRKAEVEENGQEEKGQKGQRERGELVGICWKEIHERQIGGEENYKSLGGSILRARKDSAPARLRANITDQPLSEAFPDASKIIIMSPDAEEPLTDIPSDAIFVIGGIVDRNVKKGITKGYAASLGSRCRRLPISEHAEALGLGKGAQKCPVLNIDSVVSALLDYHASGNWVAALNKVIPGRKRRDQALMNSKKRTKEEGREGKGDQIEERIEGEGKEEEENIGLLNRKREIE
uniref:tRNA (guanine(9)-N(1))-methyltransferase n=1 Tax=Polytomella parva TaxID=51329 RepID=A0A7S0UWM5_9CHLO|mmetsp:Transcript_19880/g.35808  ORF Transcript_19880/g.35808 Transcript_19880/m.35808 type:complete len:534 (+) Transcript_19880:112-1713(+)